MGSGNVRIGGFHVNRIGRPQSICLLSLGHIVKSGHYTAVLVSPLLRQVFTDYGPHIDAVAKALAYRIQTCDYVRCTEEPLVTALSTIDAGAL